jgi:phage-related protein
MGRVYYYTDEDARNPVKEFIDDLESAHQRRVMNMVELLAQEGPALRRPHSDTVRGPLKELRVRVGRLRYRILYFFLLRDAAILLHGFAKKTDKIPEGEIAIAERRMADYQARHRGGRIRL